MAPRVCLGPASRATDLSVVDGKAALFFVSFDHEATGFPEQDKVENDSDFSPY